MKAVYIAISVLVIGFTAISAIAIGVLAVLNFLGKSPYSSPPQPVPIEEKVSPTDYEVKKAKHDAVIAMGTKAMRDEPFWVEVDFVAGECYRVEQTLRAKVSYAGYAMVDAVKDGDDYWLKFQGARGPIQFTTSTSWCHRSIEAHDGK